MPDLTILLIVFVAAISAAGIWIYNRLVKDRNLVANAWSDIDIQLMRRHDLVPQLVAAVKAYADYEKATFTAVTELRTRGEQASHASDSLPDRANIEDALQESVLNLIAVAEAYPDLNADENFRQLADELTQIEDHLQYARRFYNGCVRQLNTRVATFPQVLIAGPLGFHAAEFFVAQAGAAQTPDLALS